MEWLDVRICSRVPVCATGCFGRVPLRGARHLALAEGHVSLEVGEANVCTTGCPYPRAARCSCAGITGRAHIARIAHAAHPAASTGRGG